jgi:hypothetical protein
VAAYCRRAYQLQENLTNPNRAVAHVAMVKAVLDGLERERPKWAVVVQGLHVITDRTEGSGVASGVRDAREIACAWTGICNTLQYSVHIVISNDIASRVDGEGDCHRHPTGFGEAGSQT